METKTLVQSGKRLISLDAFRGFTIAGMVIVNNQLSEEHGYKPLLHSAWNGVTPTDLVFPFFLFIMGVSVTLAFTKHLAQGSGSGELLRKAFIRALIIFGLGIFLALFPRFDFAHLRIAGVLQRIAVVYLACALIYMYTNWRQQVYIGAGLLLGYWLVMVLVPIPGLGSGHLEPGQNVAAWIDSYLLPGRMYRGTWDPEGILSTFPSIATGVTGMLCGKIITDVAHNERTVIWLFVAGFASYLVGTFWGWFFPLNKHIWTSSYVLFTSGLAAMAFAGFFWFIDVLDRKRWAKFGIIYGSNAITIYTLAGILPDFTGWNFGTHDEPATVSYGFYHALVNVGWDPGFVSLVWSVVFCLVCFIPAWVLYKRKIFIKV